MASAKASELFPEFHSKSQEKHVICDEEPQLLNRQATCDLQRQSLNFSTGKPHRLHLLPSDEPHISPQSHGLLWTNKSIHRQSFTLEKKIWSACNVNFWGLAVQWFDLFQYQPLEHQWHNALLEPGNQTQLKWVKSNDHVLTLGKEVRTPYISNLITCFTSRSTTSIGPVAFWSRFCLVVPI